MRDRRRQMWKWASLALLMILLPASVVTPVSAEEPYQSRDAVVLIANSDHGPGFVRREVLLMTVLTQFFAVRALSRGQPVSPPVVVRADSARAIARAALEGADVLVLPSWSAMAVGTPDSTQHVTNNLTDQERDAIKGWVGEGGSLLVIGRALGRVEENNLPDLLAGFGLHFRHEDRGLSDGGVEGQGSLHGQSYSLLLPGWIWSVAGGTAILTAPRARDASPKSQWTASWSIQASEQDNQRVAGAVVPFGQGRVAFLGNGNFFEQRHVLAERSPGALDRGDNIVFFIDLLASLADRPLLSPAEREHLGWEVKLLSFSASVAGIDNMNYRPRSREGSDFAKARLLLAAAERGERCDSGPGCVPFSIDDKARSELLEAARATDQALATLDRAEAALDRGEYAKVDAAYRQALGEAERAIALTRPHQTRSATLDDVPSGLAAAGLVLAMLVGGWWVARRATRAP